MFCDTLLYSKWAKEVWLFFFFFFFFFLHFAFRTNTGVITSLQVSCAIAEFLWCQLSLLQVCVHFVQALDLAAEIINLAKSGNVEVGSLSAQVPTDAARYHLFWYRHTHEGDHTESAGGYHPYCRCLSFVYYHLCSFLLSLFFFGVGGWGEILCFVIATLRRLCWK